MKANINASASKGISITTMRRIDRWLGVPLCAITTLLRPILDRFTTRPHTTKTGQKPLLVMELSEMGSTVLAYPALQNLQEAGYDLHFLIFDKNRASLELTNIIPDQQIYTIRTKSFFAFVKDSLCFLKWTRRKRISYVIDCELFSRFTMLLSAFSGAAHRVGFHRFHQEGLYRGNLLTHKVVYNPHHHIAKNYLALAYALQAPKDEVPFLKRAFDPKEIALPPFSPNTNRLEHVRQKILAHLPADCDPKAPWVLLNPNSSDMLIQRRWPVERFIELAQKIVTEHPHCTILITGASNERQQAERMVSDMHHPRIISIAGALDLQDLPYLYAQSSAMITNDSGPAHFAALAHLPTIVLFGPETPHLYRPLGAHTRTLHANLFCSPCVSAANHRKSPCSDPQCMMAIDVKDVYNCFENIIQSQAPPP